MKKSLLLLLASVFILSGCGQTGPQGPKGEQGTAGLDGQNGSDGKDGLTPFIGSNGNWWIGTNDTGIKASGSNGTNGTDGKDGLTPFIGSNGNWWIGTQDTGVCAGTVSEEYIEGKNLQISVFSGEQINMPTQTQVFDGEKWLLKDVVWSNEPSDEYSPGLYIIEGKVDGLNDKIKCYINVENYNTLFKKVCGYVNGIINNEVASVTLYNETYANTVLIKEGYYCFENVPNGKYSLKVECENYYLEKFTNISIGDVNSEDTIFSNVAARNFFLNHIENHTYYYSWSANEYCLSDEVSSSIPLNDYAFNDEVIYVTNNSSANKLIEEYKVYLNDERWSAEYSSRLYDMFTKIGVAPTKPSIWRITNEHIDNDLIVDRSGKEDIVILSMDALRYSVPTSGTLNGTKGTFFSKRIYHAVIRYLTNNGEDTSLVNNILVDKFGVSIFVPNYTELTAGITDETEEAFQQFTPEELLSILTMYEEMPQGMHKIENFKYLLRRKNGQLHPLYPTAAAVTWPQKGYIEYVDIAFTGSQFDTYRLIVHEKAHMLWEHTISEELKNDWIEIGGWYQNGDTWETTKQTEFVSAYAHDHNPNEDLAETIAFYVCDPDALQSRSSAKYEFVRDYIFNGAAYIRKIREDLTFEVLNLYPDYDYPGQVISYEVYTDNKPTEDKSFHIKLTLNHFDGLEDGAENALMRFESKTEQIYDVWLYASNATGSVLEGDLKISKFSERGYWLCSFIHIYDAQGNQRLENGNDFGCQLFVDNPLQDLEAPKYVTGSIVISSKQVRVLDPNGIERQNTEYDVKIKVDEKNFEKGHSVSSQLRIALKDNINIAAKDYFFYYNEDDGFMHATITMTEYDQSGEWEIRNISLYDEAGNSALYNSTSEAFINDNKTFTYHSDKSDFEAPVLDVNNILVNAEPTHPELPNGETKLKIIFKIKDNLSGFSHLRVWLQDPQGIRHFYDYTSKDYGHDYFYGDPTIYEDYEVKILLPVGSAPGTWGISEVEISDLVKNEIVYDFTETISFNVED